MKKILILVISMLFIGIIAFNVSIGSGNKVNDISLKNTEALACYTLEYNEHYLWTCCDPWYNTCLYEYGLPGTVYD